MIKHLTRCVAAVAMISNVLACGSSVAPTDVRTASITSAQYVRVHAVRLESSQNPVMHVWYRVVPEDPRNRISPHICSLRRVDNGVFVCDRPFAWVPVDVEWSVVVDDPAVTPEGLAPYIARDVFLNGTRVRVRKDANGSESGRFKIDEHGRIY